MPTRRVYRKKVVAPADLSCHNCVVGVDPGSTSAACVARKTKEGNWYVDGVYTIKTTPSGVKEFLGSVGPDALVVEGQFRGRAGVASLISLVRSAHVWWVCACLLGAQVKRAEPQSWYVGLFGEGSGRDKTDSRKEKAKAWCTARGIPFKDSDQADAICITAASVGGELTWTTDRSTSQPDSPKKRSKPSWAKAI